MERALVPIELVDQILDNIFQDRDIKTLGSCSLVCKLWPPISYPLIFRKAEITPEHNYGTKSDDVNVYTTSYRATEISPGTSNTLSSKKGTPINGMGMTPGSTTSSHSLYYSKP